VRGVPIERVGTSRFQFPCLTVMMTPSEIPWIEIARGIVSRGVHLNSSESCKKSIALGLRSIDDPLARRAMDLLKTNVQPFYQFAAPHQRTSGTVTDAVPDPGSSDPEDSDAEAPEYSGGSTDGSGALLV
jgi:hypothetical protein